MRRRLVNRVAMPPADLVTFRREDWAPFAPAFHELVDREGQPAAEPERVLMREFHTFVEAQRRWRDEHGWPVDSIDWIRDRRAMRLALSLETPTVGPGPALASAMRGQYRPGFS